MLLWVAMGLPWACRGLAMGSGLTARTVIVLFHVAAAKDDRFLHASRAVLEIVVEVAVKDAADGIHQEPDARLALLIAVLLVLDIKIGVQPQPALPLEKHLDILAELRGRKIGFLGLRVA